MLKKGLIMNRLISEDFPNFENLGSELPMMDNWGTCKSHCRYSYSGKF